MNNTIRPYNQIRKRKTQPYSTWFESSIKDTTEGWQENITHGQYIRKFYTQIETILRAHGYNIKDEKQFKKEIATFIYQLSDESHE